MWGFTVVFRATIFKVWDAIVQESSWQHWGSTRLDRHFQSGVEKPQQITSWVFHNPHIFYCVPFSAPPYPAQARELFWFRYSDLSRWIHSYLKAQQRNLQIYPFFYLLLVFKYPKFQEFFLNTLQSKNVRVKSVGIKVVIWEKCTSSFLQEVLNI